MAQWPGRLAAWLGRNGYPLDRIPEHLPTCSRLAVGEPPVILSPAPESEYRLRRGVKPEHQRILLEASVSNRTSEIFWFVDGEMMYHGNPSERVFMTPRRGSHTLLCMDDEGRSSEVRITVQ